MRVPASEKLEIIRLVEHSHLPARRTLQTLGILSSTFYRWYARFQTGGPEALEDKPSKPDRVWNRIPDEVRERIIAMALDVPELSPRELATRFTDAEGYFVSESSVYRLLKAHDLITSPAFVVIKAADEFKDKTTAPNQLWQTDFTYLKGDWLGLVLSVDNPRRLLALHHRLEALYDDEGRGCRGYPATGAHRLRLRPGTGDSQAAPAQRQRLQLCLRRSSRMARRTRHRTRAQCTQPSANPRQDRTLARTPPAESVTNGDTK